jgi:diguanylate cyclase (GGDEF)-like protein
MENTKLATILLVDDDEATLKLLEAILMADGYAVCSAVSGEDALISVAKHHPDLILLDIMLPNIDGFEVMRRLKADALTESIPIILLTGLYDRELRIKGLQDGGSEFLSKPIDRTELLIRVKNLLKIAEYHKSLLSHNEALNKHILWLAHFDTLTGLPNRTLLLDRANMAINIAERTHTSLTLMFLDLDHFKNINDTLGHDIGDELLKSVANRLKSITRKQDTVSRQGGDEFILVLPNTDADAALHVAESILTTLAQHFQVKHYELSITTSIGIAIYPCDGDNFGLLSRHADVAMYMAKHGGRNCFRFFSREMDVCSRHILQLENDMRHALERNQMYLCFQPVMSLQDNVMSSAEALLRWDHPQLGQISPTEFIPIAEKSGQILSIGEWCLRTVAHQLKVWVNKGMKPIPIAVNLSAVQFNQPVLLELIMQILEEVQLAPRYLELELTESVAMADPDQTISVINKLHKLGIHMSIDDFGTGFSSLSYLGSFHVHKLKIDQSFLNNLNRDNRAVVRAILSMARSLNVKTIAEGVKTKEQLIFLRKHGCDAIQGSYFSKPLLVDQFEQFMQKK